MDFGNSLFTDIAKPIVYRLTMPSRLHCIQSHTWRVWGVC